MTRPPRTLHAQVLYLGVLLRRFWRTWVALVLLVPGGGTLLWWLLAQAGKPVPWGRAAMASYFLLFAQTIIEIPDSLPVQVFYFVLPPLGFVVIVEGLVRFAYLFFARQRDDKEWFAVLAQTMTDHVIVCGAGRVGFRVFEQLQKLKTPMVVIEQREQSPLLAAIREANVPLLTADVRSPQALKMANIAKARAVVCATDDDLANLNVALDAKRLKPGIRVVLRLFDDDLVAKTRAAFDVAALSTAALAAPAFAVAALDPDIKNSFEVGGRLMVVAELRVERGLAGRTVADLRDDAGVLTIHIDQAAGGELFDPRGGVRIEAGDRVTLQSTLDAYRALRAGL